MEPCLLEIIFSFAIVQPEHFKSSLFTYSKEQGKKVLYQLLQDKQGRKRSNISRDNT